MTVRRWRSFALAAAVVVLSGAVRSGAAAASSDRSSASAFLQQTPAGGVSPAGAALIRDGFARLDEGRFDDARVLFEQAIAIGREGLPRIEAHGYRGLGRMWAHKGDLTAAREALDRSLKLFEEIGDQAGIGQAWNQVATNAFYRQLWDEAQDGYRRALAAFERAGLPGEEANVLRNLTFLPTVPQDERLRLIAAAVGRATLAKQPTLQGLSLHQWGDLLVQRNDYASAMRKLDEARAILEVHGDGNNLARLYTSIGRMFRLHGEPGLALPYYERALERQRASGDVAGEVQTLNAMALATHILRRAKEAQAHYDRALNLAQQRGTPAQVSFIQRQLGMFHVEIENVARGAALIEDGLRAELSIAERVHALSGLAKAYSSMKQHIKAEATAAEAVRLAGDSIDLEARRSAYFGRARARRAAGRPADAMDDTREALRLVEQLRPNLVQADALRLGFGERMRFQFDFAVSLFVELGRLEDAFVATEQGRSRAFLDLLASQDVSVAPSNATTPANERRRFAPAEAPSLERLKQTASRLQSTVVSYWVTSHESFVWLVLPGGAVHGHVLRVPASRLDDLVRATAAGPTSSLAALPKRGAEDGPRTSASVPQSQLVVSRQSDAAWRELYDLLILPIRQWMPRGDGSLLTIIPDGPLFRLSFAALRNERGRYLLEGYRLHYTSALSVLEFTARNKLSHPVPDRMLLVANPLIGTATVRAARLGPLPGASREAATIARLRPASQVQILSGGEASEARVRAGAPAHALLHFAAHSVVRDDRPMDSFLALAGDADDPANDGRLTALEIYGLDLQASLVVLSACRSAGGKVTGDGIVGLTRAFMSAGVPSVVASVWDLPDETAPWLFERFYAARDRVPGEVAALREAQLDLLRALRTGKFTIQTAAGTFVVPEHPAVWAGLQLWGEP